MKKMLIAASALLAVAGAPVLAQAPAAGAAPAPPPFATTKVTDNVYYFRYGGHNSMFIVTPAGVIVTDPISFRRPQAAETYMAEIRKITQAPIRYLIYSHTHYDHATGGKIFKDAGARVIAHRNAKARLEKVSNPDLVPVDEGVGDRHTINLGGVRLDLVWLGPNHSDNMLTMVLPREKLAFVVDWVPVGAGPPAALGGDMHVLEFEDSYRKLLAMNDWDRMIPGHGARLGTKQDVQFALDYHTDMRALAKTLADSNRCNAAGREATPIPAKYQGWVQPATFQAHLDRFCTFWNQGY